MVLICLHCALRCGKQSGFCDAVKEKFRGCGGFSGATDLRECGCIAMHSLKLEGDQDGEGYLKRYPMALASNSQAWLVSKDSLERRFYKRVQISESYCRIKSLANEYRKSSVIVWNGELLFGHN